MRESKITEGRLTRSKKCVGGMALLALVELTIRKSLRLALTFLFWKGWNWSSATKRTSEHWQRNGRNFAGAKSACKDLFEPDRLRRKNLLQPRDFERDTAKNRRKNRSVRPSGTADRRGHERPRLDLKMKIFWNENFSKIWTGFWKTKSSKNPVNTRGSVKIQCRISCRVLCRKNVVKDVVEMSCSRVL